MLNFFSHLAYGISIWGNMISQGQIKKLQAMQDKCVTLISHSSYKSMKLLKVCDIVKLENYKFAYKIMHNMLPDKVIKAAMSDHKGNSLKKAHSYNTCQKNLLNTPAKAANKYIDSVLCKSVLDYQSLMVETLSIKTYSSFVNQCKKLLLT